MSANPEALERTVIGEHAQAALRSLMQVWFDFERELAQVPILRKLLDGRFAKEDYRTLLLNLRQQVIEGSRWISRSASSFDRDFSDVRSEVIGHARDEHRDYEMLEKDFVAAGGDLDAIRGRERNLGSEALHGYLMYRASRPNPVELLGAMWIIEGLGEKMANDWAGRIDEQTGLDGATRFLKYHGENDDDHLSKLYQLLDRVCVDEATVAQIVKCAQVVARLYRLQLEEVTRG
ncbi:MAG: iron-containing redox enzyme family protein [Pseudomonadota bacterium]